MSKEDDVRWLEEKQENGWEVPFKAPIIFRLPVIRYFRFLYHNIKLHLHVRQYQSLGVGWGGPQRYDEWVVYAIARGWC